MTDNLDWLTARPIAHRGLHDIDNGIVENTRSAFAAAIEADYTIELDLQITSDEKAVVFHDETLKRLTRSTTPVNELTAAELQQVEFKDTSDKIQTFEQLLEFINGRVSILIELKSLYDESTRLAELVIETLKDYQGKFACMSFDPVKMATIKTGAPHFIRGALAMPQTQKRWLRASKENDDMTVMEFIDPHYLSYDVRGFPSEFAQQFRDSGKPVTCWTIKDEETAEFSRQFSDQITFEGFRP